MDPYEELGVSRTATIDEIMCKYWKLDIEYHTGACVRPEAREKFERVKAAYYKLTGRKTIYIPLEHILDDEPEFGAKTYIRKLSDISSREPERQAQRADKALNRIGKRVDVMLRESADAYARELREQKQREASLAFQQRMCSETNNRPERMVCTANVSPSKPRRRWFSRL
jgi:curved DNA-binding protein CbpA